MKPTIVLIHGAFAESSSWNQAIDRLEREGHAVIAAANPPSTGHRLSRYTSRGGG